MPLLIGIFISVALIFALIVILVLFMFFKSKKAALINMNEAKAEQEKLMLMLNTSPMSVVLFDANLNIIDCSESTLVLLGLADKQEYKNRFYTDCNPEYQPDGQRSGEKAESYLREAFETGYCFFEWTLKKPDEGSLIPTEVWLFREKFGDDDVVICYTKDMREQKEQEKQRLEAENANKTKSVFLSHVSHEIRTPMNAILGTAEIELQKEDTAPEIMEAFNIIYSSGNLLLNIINDILDLSKIEAGKLEIICDKYDIPSIIYDTVQLVLMRYDSKPIEFVLKIDENTPLDLIGDELRIKQVINNILSNAFKYTEKGTVELSVSVEPLVDSKCETHCVLVLRVTDTGQGMTEEQVNRLFDEYTRFNINANRTIVGTGLGMHITKRLLDAMNGQITIESEQGKGSVFTVRLVQERIGSSVCGSELAQQLRSNRFKGILKSNRAQIIREYMPYGSVLVVDDVESNLYVARGMMQSYGLTIETVLSGSGAVDKIKEGNKYDIIFMDHMMPVMNGIDTTKIIRDLGYTNPIIALTANAVAGTSAMFLENGFDGFMSKPIDTRELNSLLNRLIRDKQPHETVEAARKLMKSQKPANNTANGSLYKNDFSKIVMQDIKKALSVFEDILPKLNESEAARETSLQKASLSLFTITVHGMKSALMNIGETQLYAAALKLEQAGEAGKVTEILSDTPLFMNALRTVIEKHKPKEADNNDELSDEDKIVLSEKLIEIKTACERIQKRAAKTALDDLKNKKWSCEVNELLDEISLYILHGEFKKAAAVVENSKHTREDK